MNYTVQIEFDTEATEEEFKEWLHYKIGWGGCSCDNPLIDKDMSDIVSYYNVNKWG